jgi:hypothetical protein
MDAVCTNKANPASSATMPRQVSRAEFSVLSAMFRNWRNKANPASKQALLIHRDKSGFALQLCRDKSGFVFDYAVINKPYLA